MPTFPLKNGESTEDPRSDRVEEFDARSLDYRVRELLRPSQLEHPRSYTWRVTQSLDQGGAGACVGFAWAHELVARPAEMKGVSADFAHDVLYWSAQKRDRYPGGSYPGASPIASGTSVLAGAKVAKSLGFIREYRWCTQFEELVAVLGYKGPVVLGCPWFQGMRTPDPDGFVAPTGRRIGGHCSLLNGVRIVRSADGELDPVASWVRFHNSYGLDWGDHGSAKVLFTEMPKLLKQADMCVPIGRRRGSIEVR